MNRSGGKRQRSTYAESKDRYQKQQADLLLARCLSEKGRVSDSDFDKIVAKALERTNAEFNKNRKAKSLHPTCDEFRYDHPTVDNVISVAKIVLQYCPDTTALRRYYDESVKFLDTTEDYRLKVLDYFIEAYSRYRTQDERALLKLVTRVHKEYAPERHPLLPTPAEDISRYPCTPFYEVFGSYLAFEDSLAAIAKEKADRIARAPLPPKPTFKRQKITAERFSAPEPVLAPPTAPAPRERTPRELKCLSSLVTSTDEQYYYAHDRRSSGDPRYPWACHALSLSPPLGTEHSTNPIPSTYEVDDQVVLTPVADESDEDIVDDVVLPGAELAQ